MQGYDTAPLFNGNVWFVLCVISALGISVVMASMIYRMKKWNPLVVEPVQAEQPMDDDAHQGNQGVATSTTLAIRSDLQGIIIE